MGHKDLDVWKESMILVGGEEGNNTSHTGGKPGEKGQTKGKEECGGVNADFLHNPAQ